MQKNNEIITIEIYFRENNQIEIELFLVPHSRHSI